MLQDHRTCLNPFDVEGGIGTAGFFSSDIIPSHTLEGARVLQPVHSRKAQATALGEAPFRVLDRCPIEQPVHMYQARSLDLTAKQRPAPLQCILGGRLLDEDDGCLGTAQQRQQQDAEQRQPAGSGQGSPCSSHRGGLGKRS